jgi:hypothetical protein
VARQIQDYYMDYLQYSKPEDQGGMACVMGNRDKELIHICKFMQNLD